MNYQITQRKTGVIADCFPFKLGQILGYALAGEPRNSLFLAAKSVNQFLVQCLTAGKDRAIGGPALPHA